MTDAGLIHLRGLTRLTFLGLDKNSVNQVNHISDSGLENLRGLTNLRFLALCGTQVTDAGMAHLKGLASLRDLRLGGTRVTDKGVAELLRALPKFRITGCDLRLMSSVNDVTAIPTAGKSLVIVAAVNHVLHFRILDADGKMIVFADEKRLTKQARQIEDLRKQLESLWPPHELTKSEKDQVIDAVSSIVDHTRISY
ncbi:MAG TPA: hypothetical protein VKA15_09215 [Isosphaeraceae bacterium]|nr:hypothetical protein [Isosphaeraceae bacterium]